MSQVRATYYFSQGDDKTMTWRPEDWNKKAKELHDVICVPGSEVMSFRDIIEASADVIVEALRKEAIVIVHQTGVNEGDVITWTVPRVFTDSIVKGVLVFIPDERTEDA